MAIRVIEINLIYDKMIFNMDKFLYEIEGILKATNMLSFSGLRRDYKSHQAG